MTIDEAIAHAREVATEQKRRSGTCVTNDNECDKFSNCIKCAEEHEKLAEWLEELKDYRDKNKMVVRVDVENMDNIKDKIEELSKYAERQYNKAIDDTVRAIKGLYTFTILEEEEIDEMTRQLKLKAGGKNEQSI